MMNYDTFEDYCQKNQIGLPFASKHKNFQNDISSKVITENNIKRPEIARIPTVIEKRIIYIDSDDRDIEAFPTINHFKVNSSGGSTRVYHTKDTNGNLTKVVHVDNSTNLGRHLKNIVSLTFKECILPDFTATNPYLVLNIPEIQQNPLGTNSNLNEAFAILLPERKHSNYLTCKTVEGFEYIFNPPLAKLPNLTISIYEDNFDTVTGKYKLYEFQAGTKVLISMVARCERPDKTFISNEYIA